MDSWAKKELAKLRIYKFYRMHLPRINAAPVNSSTVPSVQEVVLAADLGCANCQKRVADAISSIDGKDMESMVVHMLEKKVTLAHKTVAEGSSTKVAAAYNYT